MNMRNLFASIVFWLLLAQPIVAATFTVTNNADSGLGTLRQAVLDANLNSGVDTIDFAPQVVGTILLTSQIEITDDLTIMGPGAKTLSVVGATRVFRVSAAVSISGLRLAGTVIGM